MIKYIGMHRYHDVPFSDFTYAWDRRLIDKKIRLKMIWHIAVSIVYPFHMILNLYLRVLHDPLQSLVRIEQAIDHILLFHDLTLNKY